MDTISRTVDDEEQPVGHNLLEPLTAGPVADTLSKRPIEKMLARRE